jgi:hypothetical protein
LKFSLFLAKVLKQREKLVSIYKVFFTWKKCRAFFLSTLMSSIGFVDLFPKRLLALKFYIVTDHEFQANEATDSQGQEGVVSEKKKKTRRPPRNKKVFKTENGSEDVDGPNAGTESQVKNPFIEPILPIFFTVNA